MSRTDGRPVLPRLTEGARNYPAHAASHGIQLAPLADVHSPKVMFIACSDARLVPTLITGSLPGEVFELRTHGAVLPRFDPERPSGEALTIEYAVATLKVTDIVVCGHSHCDVVDVGVTDGVQSAEEAGALTTGDFTAAGHSHVVRQLDVLSDYAFVAPRLADGSLRTHGWYHELETGSTLRFRPHLSSFLPL
ncbi:carbonic anhydrase [Streptomyces sp. NBC_00239]|uniref:carbonic anhydrase n=1 Tax=Streptomyces sp. NBC_00239 TaxID=2903640 RepID=UPI002E28DAE0|nr:carbonic anhydrase [Streptomyces sp. NBC_00239]